MGGSLALAVREKGLFSSVIGHDSSEEHQRTALQMQMIDRACTLAELLETSDLTIFAVPVESIVALMPALTHAKKGAVFADLGSTKTVIVNAISPAHRSRFVCAHPMAGTEYSGPKAAFAALYANRTVVLCDTADNDQDAVQTVREMFEMIGMKIVLMNALAHDRHAAFISHLPHAISYALANSVLSQEDNGSILTLAAGGFRDMSRLAKSSSAMWIDIFKQNKEAILASLDVFNSELSQCETLLREERWKELEQWMKSASSLHEIFR